MLTEFTITEAPYQRRHNKDFDREAELMQSNYAGNQITFNALTCGKWERGNYYHFPVCIWKIKPKQLKAA